MATQAPMVTANRKIAGQPNRYRLKAVAGTRASITVAMVFWTLVAEWVKGALVVAVSMHHASAGSSAGGGRCGRRRSLAGRLGGGLGGGDLLEARRVGLGQGLGAFVLAPLAFLGVQHPLGVVEVVHQRDMRGTDPGATPAGEASVTPSLAAPSRLSLRM